jgi:hypothetical protein
MKAIRSLLLGSALALPAVLAAGTASAQTRDGVQVIRLAPGTTLMIVSSPDAAPVQVQAAQAQPMQVETVDGVPADAAPLLRLIAQQQAAMQQMMANMNALFPPMPDPSAMLAAMQAGTAGPFAGFGLAMPQLAGGHGVCSQSVSYVSRGDGSAPIVKVTQSGDACGPVAPGGVDAVTQPVAPSVPAAIGPKVYDISYPPQPLKTATPPRT